MNKQNEKCTFFTTLQRKGLAAGLLAALLSNCIALSLLVVSNVSAETSDFGGYPEEYKGDGDLHPPRCQVTAPRSAQEPFSVQWNCVDNDKDHSPQSNIRTSVWVKRQSDTRWRIVDHFLSFPASLLVDKSLLLVAPDGDFKTGLPVTIRIEASDAAGNTTFSPQLLVLRSDTELQNCNLDIMTIESSGDTASASVAVDNASVIVSKSAENVFRIAASSSVVASPCEIDAVCANDDEISFQASITVENDNTAEGTLAATPGVSSSVSGSVESTGGAISSLNVTGTTSIDGVDADVTLSCS